MDTVCHFDGWQAAVTTQNNQQHRQKQKDQVNYSTDITLYLSGISGAIGNADNSL